MLQQLLAKGYRVRGTVRSERKVNQLRKQYADVGDQLELVVVEDMQVDGAFDSFLDGSPFVNVSNSRRRWNLSCCESVPFQAGRQRERFTFTSDKRDDKYP